MEHGAFQKLQSCYAIYRDREVQTQGRSKRYILLSGRQGAQSKNTSRNPEKQVSSPKSQAEIMKPKKTVRTGRKHKGQPKNQSQKNTGGGKKKQEKEKRMSHRQPNRG